VQFSNPGAGRYNRAVSIAGGRGTGIAILIALFALGLVLAHAPFDPGSLRLAGVSVLWWYALGAAPLVGGLMTAVLLFRSGD
jgi:hypothetical protein